MDCIFCAIITGRAAGSIVHRDDECVAFMDIRPVTPGHLLVVPLMHAASLGELPANIGKAMFALAQHLTAAVRRSGVCADGVTLLLADGEAAGQEVFHVHLHVIPRFAGDGFGLRLPAGYGAECAREELEAAAAAVRSALSR
jgi:histidine triad (HIT) family protein